jgi:hypothetical protein
MKMTGRLYSLRGFALLACIGISGCNSAPSRISATPSGDEKIKITASKFISRIDDLRPEQEKSTRLERKNGVEVQLLGDNAFSISPINEMASALSTWAYRNPNKTVKLNSLLIHFADDKTAKKIEFKSSSAELGYGPGGKAIGGIVISLVDYAMMPRGYTAVVQLHATVDGKNFVIQHSQTPIYRGTSHETVAAALNYAGYKLNLRLLE